MKQFRILSILMLIALSSSLRANILTLNNSNPSPGQYTTGTAAVAAAVNGDTIMVAGTDISYGDLTINKPLTLMGPGWVVSGGGISRVAQFGNIIVSTHNISIIGIRTAFIYTSNASETFVNNLKVMRCIIDVSIDALAEDCTNGVIEGNVFSTFNVFSLTSNNSSLDYIGCSVRNNIFSGYIYSAENTNISHNIFLGGSLTTSIASGNVINGSFTGNIAINRNLSSVSASNNISGNVSWGGSGTWLQAGNLTDVDPLFVNSPTQTSLFNWLFDFHLQAGSPAIGAGPGGDDAGIFGGDGVYRQDGEPSVPIVRAVNVPGGGVVPANATFNINVISVAHE